MLQKEMPLKLIIMSATLKVEEFTENKLLFSSPPVVLNVWNASKEDVK